jgi:heptosyltransferase II
MRVGVFLPNWIGDVVMATPALRALRNHLGADVKIIGVMRPYVAEVLAGTSWLDEAILYTKEDMRIRAGQGTADCPSCSIIKALRAARLDRVLLFTNSFRTAWMAWRSGARERIGYVGNLRSWLLTERLPLPRKKQSPLPPIDSYLQLASTLGCEVDSRRLELATTPADERAADVAWQKLGLATGEEVIMLNSGGAYGTAKHWPAEHFASLARRIVDESDYRVLVNCGPAERHLAAEIVTRADDHRVVSLADVKELPIGVTKACVRRSRMLVTTDSGPRFFGIAFGKPVVSLFGPTDPAATRTCDPAEITLSLLLSCQPCGERECPLAHHRCMKDLSVSTVFDAVARSLQEVTSSTIPHRSFSIQHPAA